MRNIRVKEEEWGRGTVWGEVGGGRGRQRRHTGICIHVPKLRRRARLLVARARERAGRWGCAWGMSGLGGGVCVFHLLSCA